MEKRSTARRFLSLLIAVLMVTSVIPQAAYAAIADAAGTDRAPGRAVVNGGVDGTAIEIEGVNSVIVSGATEQENGDYVWTPSNTNPDHPFKFNVTYSVSGEFEYFESNQIEVRIPLSILKDQNGNPADYFEMSLPRDDEEGLDDDNVFVYRIDEETNEIVVYNRLPCPAAQHGYFEISYSTNKRTYDYQDYDPDGEKPEDRNPSADFQATLTISRDGETHSETSDPVHVYIDDKGVTCKLLPEKTVILGSRDGLEGTRCYGAIHDEKANWTAHRYFTKSWVEEDPSVRWLLLQSAPLVVPYRPNASMFVNIG